MMTDLTVEINEGPSELVSTSPSAINTSTTASNSEEGIRILYGTEVLKKYEHTVVHFNITLALNLLKSISEIILYWLSTN